jgi:type IV pilus assembly protein PilC
MVMGLGAVLASPAFYVTLAALGGLAALYLPPWLRQPRVRRRLAEEMLKVPGLGPSLRSVAISRFTRSLAIELEVGLNAVEAIDMAARAADHPVLEAVSSRAQSALQAGKSLQESLADTGFFPKSYTSIVSVGEESGQTPAILRRLADMYEAEIDYRLDVLTALVEPLVMLVMGSIVGVVVIATMLPMLALLRHL